MFNQLECAHRELCHDFIPIIKKLRPKKESNETKVFPASARMDFNELTHAHVVRHPSAKCGENRRSRKCVG